MVGKLNLAKSFAGKVWPDWSNTVAVKFKDTRLCGAYP
jgi:hypothetical protein